MESFERSLSNLNYFFGYKKTFNAIHFSIFKFEYFVFFDFHSWKENILLFKVRFTRLHILFQNNNVKLYFRKKCHSTLLIPDKKSDFERFWGIGLAFDDANETHKLWT